jgi:hypothetical protein
MPAASATIPATHAKSFDIQKQPLKPLNWPTVNTASFPPIH